MRNLTILLAVLLLTGLTAAAPADEIHIPSTGPGNNFNAWPFGSGPEWCYQLYLPKSVLGGQGFAIQDIAFLPANSGGLNATLMVVRMSHTTVKVSSIFAINLSNPTTVLTSTNYSWAATNKTWSPIGLTGQFIYDGVSDLTIEMRYKGWKLTGSWGGNCYFTNSAPHTRIVARGTGAFQATSGFLIPNSGLSVRLTVVRAMITPSGTGQIGTAVSFNLFAPGEAGKAYQAGSSLGQGPISIGTHKLPLEVDNLLALSVGGLAPTLFKDYAGNLDAKGAGVATINIPKITALKGVRFYTAYVTLDAAKPFGVGQVSEKNVMITIS